MMDVDDIDERFMKKIARHFVRMTKTGGRDHALAYINRVNPTPDFKKRLTPLVKEELKHYGR